MPRQAFNLNLSDDLRDLIANFGDEAGEVISEGIRKGLDLANQYAVGIIKRKRMTGSGPFPVSQHRLGHTPARRLSRAFNNAPAKIIDAKKGIVVASMGSNVSYFGAHEFGFDGPVKVPAHTREMPDMERTSSKGKKYRVPAHSQKVKAHSRHLKIPERKPVRAELETRSTQKLYDNTIADGVSKELDQFT